MNVIEYRKKWIENLEGEIEKETNDKYKREMRETLRHEELNNKLYERLILKGQHQICEICGIVSVNTQYLHRCFHCHLWGKRYEDFKNCPNTYVIDGTLWTDKGFSRDKSKYLGCAGRLFKVKPFDGDSFETNNLRCGGDIPKSWHTGELKNNAEFETVKKGVL